MKRLLFFAIICLTLSCNSTKVSRHLREKTSDCELIPEARVDVRYLSCDKDISEISGSYQKGGGGYFLGETFILEPSGGWLRRKANYGEWHRAENVGEVSGFWECDSTFIQLGGGVKYHAVSYDSIYFFIPESELNCFLNYIYREISEFSPKSEQDSLDNLVILKEMKLKSRYFYKISSVAEAE